MVPDGNASRSFPWSIPFKPKIVAYDVATKKEELIGEWEGGAIDSVGWMGNDGLVAAASQAPGSPSQLWYQAYPGGARRRLSNDTSQYHFVKFLHRRQGHWRQANPACGGDLASSVRGPA